MVPDALGSKILDPDEKVRVSVCKLFSHLDYETALHHVSEKLLRLLAGRGLDKKVRAPGLMCGDHAHLVTYSKVFVLKLSKQWAGYIVWLIRRCACVPTVVHVQPNGDAVRTTTLVRFSSSHGYQARYCVMAALTPTSSEFTIESFYFPS